MDFQTAVRTCFEKYFVFEGRAARPEFWWFALFVLLARIVLGIIDRTIFGGPVYHPAMMSYGMSEHGMWSYGMWSYGVWMPSWRPLSGLFSLAVFIPKLSVAVRRLPDVDRSGWWLLLSLIPIIGWLVLLYWVLQPGRAGSNMYGVAPEV